MGFPEDLAIGIEDEPSSKTRVKVRHTGDCSFWNSPICDCGALRKAASCAWDVEDKVWDDYAEHCHAVQVATDIWNSRPSQQKNPA